MDGLKLLGFCGLGGAGIAGTACLGYVFVQPKNVLEELVKYGKTPLTFDGDKDDEIWKTLLEKHKNSGVSNPVKINGLILNTDIKPLKDKCKDLLLTKKGNSGWDKAYTDASNWCVKPDSKK